MLSADAADKILTRGEPLTLTWVAPTHRENGDIMSLSELSHFTIFWTCDSSGDGTLVINTLMTTASLDSTNLLGNCSMRMTATDKDDITSVDSDEVTILVRLPKPSSGGFR